MTLRVLPIGVGDAFSARHYSTCLALEAEGQWLLIDCPHPIRKMVREASATAGLAIDIDVFQAVVLTHLHADHSSGLESFGYFHLFVLGQKPLLIAHPAVSSRLWEGHLAAGMEQLLPGVGAEPRAMALGDYFETGALDEHQPIVHGPFSIECRRTIHHIPTTALRIRAGGRCFGYSADTTFDRGLIDWLAEADLVFHETGYGIHTPYDTLAGLPAELRCRMRLVHCPDELESAPEILRQVRQGELIEI